MPAGTRQGVKVGGVVRLGLCQYEEHEIYPEGPLLLGSRQQPRRNMDPVLPDFEFFK